MPPITLAVLMIDCPSLPRLMVTSMYNEAVASGATVLVASHELERAGSLAHRVVEVVAGQVRETGDER